VNRLGDMFDVTSYAYGWNSSNMAVATLPTRALRTVGGLAHLCSLL
jgi:hypothetical protein